MNAFHLRTLPQWQLNHIFWFLNIPSCQIEIEANILFISNQTNSQISLIFEIHLNDELNLVLYGIHKNVSITDQTYSDYWVIVNANLKFLDPVERASRGKQPLNSGRIG